MDKALLNTKASQAIVDELNLCSVKDMILSPGARSAPLALAAERHPEICVKTHFDERGTAFYALGLAKAKNEAVAMLCTSGTAVANFLPAIVEAFQDSVPLIVLTADRPPELQKLGANQSINQSSIFSSFVVESFEMPVPEADVPEKFLRSRIAQAVHLAKSRKGPVHLNCPMREPLKEADFDFPYSLQTHTSYVKTLGVLEKSALESVVEDLSVAKKAVIVVGTVHNDLQAQAIAKFASSIKWPLLPDVTSQLRFTKQNEIIPYYDLLLEDLEADCILHFGSRMTSKDYLQWAEKQDCVYFQVNDNDQRQDPKCLVSHKIEMDPRIFIEQVLTVYSGRKSENLELLQKASEEVDAYIEQFCSESVEVDCVRELIASLRGEHAVFLASSLSIRTVDRFAPYTTLAKITTASNRACNGIDGTIATAIAFAEGLERPLSLVMGDLAFLHDVNSLALLKECSQPVIVFLINNNGGGIFSNLDLSDRKEALEKVVTTPQNFDLSPLAKAFNIRHVQVKERASFSLAYEAALLSEENCIIELQSSCKTNALDQKILTEKIRQVLHERNTRILSSLTL